MEKPIQKVVFTYSCMHINIYICIHIYVTIIIYLKVGLWKELDAG